MVTSLPIQMKTPCKRMDSSQRTKKSNSKLLQPEDSFETRQVLWSSRSLVWKRSIWLMTMQLILTMIARLAEET